MKQEEEPITGLPENAFRELKPGEVYNPLMSPDKKYSEVNAWSVTWGILMAILFSAAAAYLGLKVGQVFEAAIPIAIIAVGVSGAAKRKNALGENVIIQSIGASSGVIVQVPSSPFRHFISFKKLIRKKSPLPLHKSLSALCWEVCWVFSSLSPSANIS